MNKDENKAVMTKPSLEDVRLSLFDNSINGLLYILGRDNHIWREVRQ
jgi:hypothetical protein